MTRVSQIGIIGCGFVFDHYLTTWARHPELRIAGVADLDPDRLAAVAAYYGVRPTTVDELLDDPLVSIIVNLTSIPAHFEITKKALLAGKHVYSEKPLVTELDQARGLVELAEQRGLRLSCAPSNALSATTRTMAAAVEAGLVGDVKLVYAEYDDNPIYLRKPENWRSRSGAPWPYLHEYEMGCTFEHAGYHLSWMCAMFGPVRSVTAFSKVTIADKTPIALDPPDTPDFSVACLDFVNGTTGRLTFSIAAPYDHRMRIIGDRGVIEADSYRHYECPVTFEQFTELSLGLRNYRAIRRSSVLGRLAGTRGAELPLVEPLRTSSARTGGLRRWFRSPRLLASAWRSGQVGQQDKALGVAELAAAIDEGRPQFPSPEFTLHVTELTLAIQRAGVDGSAHRLETTFEPFDYPRVDDAATRRLRSVNGQGPASRLRKLVSRLR